MSLATAILPAPAQQPRPRTPLHSRAAGDARARGPLRLFTHAPERCTFLSQQLHRYGEWEPRLSREILARFGGPPSPPPSSSRGAQQQQQQQQQQQHTPPQQRRVLLDVGGHIGWYALLVGAAGHRALSLEPMRFNRELFEASVALNGLRADPTNDVVVSGQVHVTPGVTVMAAAAGGAGNDGSGPALCMRPMGGHEHNAGNGQIFLRHDEAASSGGASGAGGGRRRPAADGDGVGCLERVRTTSLDALLYGSYRVGGGAGAVASSDVTGLWGGALPPPIWGAKLDIEGFEVHALRGAWRLLSDVARRPCFIWLEHDEVLAAQVSSASVYWSLMRAVPCHPSSACLTHHVCMCTARARPNQWLCLCCAFASLLSLYVL